MLRGASPYAAPPTDDAESFSQVFGVSDLNASQLPDGWTVGSAGNLQLTSLTRLLILGKFVQVAFYDIMWFHVAPPST